MKDKQAGTHIFGFPFTDIKSTAIENANVSGRAVLSLLAFNIPNPNRSYEGRYCALLL
jgi:hypothetical protein